MTDPPVEPRCYGDVEKARVTLITPTRPGREAQLAECRASVEAQTEPVAHLSLLDAALAGPAATRNKLLNLVQTPYVGFLDDDDLLDPEHVESLMALMVNGAGPDLAWSRCRLFFAPGVDPIRILQPLRIDYGLMCRSGRNYIPVTVIAKTDAIRSAGCFDEADRYEDYALWCRMFAAGARFAHLPRITWTYRFLGENRTHE
jgi:hypothetical protein